VRSGGLSLVDDTQKPTSGATVVPQPLLDSMPTVSATIGSQQFVRASSGGLYLLSGGTRRLVASNTDRNAIAESLGIPAKTFTLPTDTVVSWPGGGRIVPPGSLLTADGGKTTWLIDGTSVRYEVPLSLASQISTGSARKVSSAYLTGYQDAGDATPEAVCGTTPYLFVSGVLRQIRSTARTDYEGAFAPMSFDASTCSTITVKGPAIGQLLFDGKYYFVVLDGTRHKVKTGETPSQLVAKYGKSTTLPAAYIAMIPGGGALTR
jgi:hypothetical protein